MIKLLCVFVCLAFLANAVEDPYTATYRKPLDGEYVLGALGEGGSGVDFGSGIALTKYYVYVTGYMTFSWLDLSRRIRGHHEDWRRNGGECWFYRYICW